LWQSDGDATVIMDGDMQDPPGLIYDFVQKWLEGYSVVYGVRAKRHEAWWRQIGYKVFYRIFRGMASFDVPLDAGEFSLMDRNVVEVILACKKTASSAACGPTPVSGRSSVRAARRFSGEHARLHRLRKLGDQGLISFSVSR
jgi:dolichol-phosphate mannosyltransferase